MKYVLALKGMWPLHEYPSHSQFSPLSIATITLTNLKTGRKNKWSLSLVYTRRQRRRFLFLLKMGSMQFHGTIYM